MKKKVKNEIFIHFIQAFYVDDIAFWQRTNLTKELIMVVLDMTKSSYL